MLRYWFFIFVAFFLSLSAHAQQYLQKLDSLNAVMPNTTGPHLTRTLDKIREYSILVPQQNGFNKLSECLEAAKEIKKPFAVFMATYNLGYLFAHHQQQTKALEYIQEGLTYAKEQNDSFTLAISYYYTALARHAQAFINTSGPGKYCQTGNTR